MKSFQILMINNEKKVLSTIKSRCLDFKISLTYDESISVINDILGKNVFDFVNKDLLNYYLGEFYAITSSTKIKFNKLNTEPAENKKPIKTSLQIHEEHVNALEKLKVKLDKENFNDADLLNKKKLLSYIIQELAIKTGGIYTEKNNLEESPNNSEFENLHKKIINLFDQSLLLKKETGDLKGQIINLGSRGHYLFTARNDYDKAFECYQEYLSIAEKIGDDVSKSIINNKIAGYYYEKYSIDETKTDFLQKACDKAHESYLISLEIDNKSNILFAFKNILEYASKLNDLTLIDKVGSELNQRDIFKEIPPFMNSMILNIITNFEHKWEKWDWAQNLKELLTKSER